METVSVSLVKWNPRLESWRCFLNVSLKQLSITSNSSRFYKYWFSVTGATTRPVRTPSFMQRGYLTSNTFRKRIPTGKSVFLRNLVKLAQHVFERSQFLVVRLRVFPLTVYINLRQTIYTSKERWTKINCPGHMIPYMTESIHQPLINTRIIMRMVWQIFKTRVEKSAYRDIAPYVLSKKLLIFKYLLLRLRFCIFCLGNGHQEYFHARLVNKLE